MTTEALDLPPRRRSSGRQPQPEAPPEEATLEAPEDSAPEAQPEEATLEAAPEVPPPPVHPEAARGVSTSELVCAVCRRPIPAGETYVKGAETGYTHAEPCSHNT